MCKIALIILTLLLLAACQHEPLTTEIDPNGLLVDECDSDTVYFQNAILPMLISNCSTSGCHDVETAEDDVILVDYDYIINTADVEAFDPDAGHLMEVITETDPEDIMPPSPNTPLTQDQIDMLYTWINQGALNNYCGDCDTNQFTFSTTIHPLIDLKCKGCHSGAEPAADFNLITYEDISEISTNGILLDVLDHSGGDFANMPPSGGQLPDCEIQQITRWINAGALEN